MSILHYNGGCVVAMAGKDCVAIASDRRLGVQLVSNSTIYFPDPFLSQFQSYLTSFYSDYRGNGCQPYLPHA